MFKVEKNNAKTIDKNFYMIYNRKEPLGKGRKLRFNAPALRRD